MQAFTLDASKHLVGKYLVALSALVVSVCLYYWILAPNKIGYWFVPVFIALAFIDSDDLRDTRTCKMQPLRIIPNKYVFH